MSGRLLPHEARANAEDALLARLDECPQGVTIRWREARHGSYELTADYLAASRLALRELVLVAGTGDPEFFRVVRKGVA